MRSQVRVFFIIFSPFKGIKTQNNQLNSFATILPTRMLARLMSKLLATDLTQLQQKLHGNIKQARKKLPTVLNVNNFFSRPC